MGSILRTNLPRLGDRVSLGTTGLAVSPVCLGVSTEDTVIAAFEAGINFFFVSTDLHWPAYEGTRRGLARLLRRGVPRDALVVAATTYIAQREFADAPFAELLHAVPELDRLDVIVAGGTYAADYPGRRGVHAGQVEARRFGARALGVSFHDREPVAAAINAGELDVAFIRYNPGHLGAQATVFPAVSPTRSSRLYGFKSTIGVDAVAALVRADPTLDVWIPDVPDYYRFALARPQVDGVLCSLFAPREVEALAEVLAGPALAPEEEDHMSALVAAAVRSRS